MQSYKVIGSKAVLGVGLILKLTDSQAKIRLNSLKQQKKNIYIVLEAIEFKHGEKVTIVSGNISKAVLENLEDIPKNSKIQEQKQEADIKEDININNLPSVE